jgi:redox-sensing transcriptional repressor
MDKGVRIPDATIERIALYARPLESLIEKGIRVISSEKFAEMCKANSAQVRKDLSYFGEFGVRGVGYDVQDLLMEIKKILVSDREWKLGIVGVGNMGMALVQHENFFKRDYRFVAAFDSDPQKIGKGLSRGLIIQPVTKIEQLTQELGIELGVITTPSSQAQSVADMLVDAGIKAILNFSPIQVRMPKGCLVQNVDFTVNLDNLAYHLNKID